MSKEATADHQATSLEMTVEERLKLSPYRQLKPIIFSQKEFAEKSRVFYRVYTDKDTFELVEAHSAHEAYTKSGLSRVYRIERESMLRYLSVDESKVTPTDRMYEGNLDLPEPELCDVTYDDSMNEFAAKLAEGSPFEEMELGDLHHKHDGSDLDAQAGSLIEPDPESVAGAYLEEQPEPVSEPVVEPDPEPQMAAEPEPEPVEESVMEEPSEPEEAAPAEEEAEDALDMDELSEEEVAKLLAD
ncbi:MAG: hypothetical protein MRY32_08925 [Rickettsiales bacterium]|nr:hypothetical protein [Rickettsiales bacterium]